MLHANLFIPEYLPTVCEGVYSNASKMADTPMTQKTPVLLRRKWKKRGRSLKSGGRPHDPTISIGINRPSHRQERCFGTDNPFKCSLLDEDHKR